MSKSVAKPKPGTDFMRQNRNQILEQQMVNKQRQQQDEFVEDRKRQIIAKQKAQYASGPRVNMTGHANAPREDPNLVSAEDEVQISVYVRECDADGTSYTQLESALQQAAKARQSQQQRPPIQAARAPAAAPPAAQRAPSSGRRGSGSGTASGAPVLNLPRRPPSGAPSDVSGTMARGQVPQYLKDRKAELQAEKDEARRIADIRAEQAKYPPGHRPVSEDERQEILQRLQQRKKELEGDLGRLPMRFDTQAIRNKRLQIEAEMQEVETAERKFSVKKQLFVPI